MSTSSASMRRSLSMTCRARFRSRSRTEETAFATLSSTRELKERSCFFRRSISRRKCTDTVQPFAPLTETAGDIVFRLFLFRLGEQLLGVIELDQLAFHKKCRVIGDT